MGGECWRKTGRLLQILPDNRFDLGAGRPVVEPGLNERLARTVECVHRGGHLELGRAAERVALLLDTKVFFGGPDRELLDADTLFGGAQRRELLLDVLLGQELRIAESS